MSISRFLTLFAAIFLLFSCEHFEQDAAEVANIGDKYYGEAKKRPTIKKGQALKPVTAPNPESIPSNIATNYAEGEQQQPSNIQPNSKVSSDENGVFVYHEVKNGETVYMLSRQYKLSPRKIIANNHLNEPYELVIGDIIKIHSPIAVSKAKGTVTQAAKPYIKEEVITQKTYAEHIDISNDEQAESYQTIKKTTKKIAKKYDNKNYIWPVKGQIISKFGTQASGIKNDGIVIKASKGTEMIAPKCGEVVYAGDEISDFGNMVIVKHDQNTFTTYAHLDNILINQGDKIDQGEVIGHVGSSGSVKNPCLYFSMRKGKKPLNPAKILGAM